MTRPWSSIAVLFLATSLWGVSSALIAAVATTGFSSAVLVAAGGSAVILTIAVIRGNDPLRLFAADRSLYIRLGLLEIANLALYVGALRTGPLPLAVALHLAAPVLIICARLISGKRSVSAVVVGELVLIVIAIGLVVERRPTTESAGGILVGCLLALGSAACVAGLITVVSSAAESHGSVASAGLQLAVAALAGLPLAVFNPPSGRVCLELLMIGGLFLGPGFVCYWWALRTLDATTAGIIGLNEAVAASVIGAIFARGQLAPAVLVAGLLVLIAVGAEIRVDPRSGAPRRRTPRMPPRPCLRWASRHHC